MKTHSTRLIVALWFTLGLNGASSQSITKQQTPVAPQCVAAKGDAAKEPVAMVAGQPIEAHELDDLVASQIVPLRNQEYQIRSKALEELIRQRLVEAEAKRRGLTAEQLYTEDVDSKIAAPTDGEVGAYYIALKAQIKAPLEQVRTQLRTNLRAAETRQARQDYADALRAESDVALLLKQPRVDVGFDRSRLRGDPKAPVTIVEFADYQCPYCKQTEATVEALLKTYPGQVNVAFRDFPLTSIHPYAQKASEASRCAGKQGKYWEYHDALFASQPKLDDANLTTIAHTVALDENAFAACLSSGEFKNQISQDRQDGKKAGISSTPGFFINGILLSGAQPESEFDKVIDEQLKAAKTQPVVRAAL